MEFEFPFPNALIIHAKKTNKPQGARVMFITWHDEEFGEIVKHNRNKIIHLLEKQIRSDTIVNNEIVQIVRKDDIISAHTLGHFMVLCNISDLSSETSFYKNA